MIMIVFAMVLLFVLLDIAALRWGYDSTDGREGYVREMEHHSLDGFSAEHHTFSTL